MPEKVRAIVIIMGIFATTSIGWGYSVKIELDTSLTMKEIRDSVLIEIPEGVNLAPQGQPDIPARIIRILIPQGKTITGFSYSFTSSPMNLKKPPLLSRGPLKIGSSEDPDNTGENQPCRITADGYLAGFHIVTIAVMPVIYEDGKWFRNNAVNLYFELKDDLFSPPVPATVLQREREFLRNTLANPQLIESYAPSSPSFITFSLNALPSDLHSVLPEGIIITSPRYYQVARWYRNERLKLGNPSILLTTEEISSSIPGENLPEKIRSLLRAMFQLYGIKWVFIIGEESDVPMQTLYPSSPSGLSQPVKGDYYYAALDGDFDSNRDGILGNSVSDDPYPELAVGRIEVPDSSTLRNVLTKLLRISKGDYPLEIDRVLLVGADISRGDSRGQILKDKIRLMLNALGGYTVWRLYSSSGDANLNAENFLSELASGYYIVNHIDHSTEGSVGAGVVSSGEYLESNVLAGAPISPLLFVSMGCNTASHIANSPMNALVNAPAGAFAYIGFSSASYSTELPVDSILFKSFLVDRMSLGEGVRFCKINFSHDRYLASALTFSGDPSFYLFNAAGETLKTELLFPFLEGTRTGSIRVTTSSGAVVPGARVTFYQGGLYYMTETGTDGVARFSLLFSPGELSISATKPGYIPITKTVIISPSSSFRVLLSNVSVSEIFGNGNTSFDSGESLAISLRFYNAGNLSSPPANILISSTSPHFAILDTNIGLGTIPAQNETTVRVKAYVLPSMRTDNFVSVRIKSEAIALDENLMLQLSSPCVFIFQQSRNPSCSPRIGDTIVINLRIKNCSCENISGLTLYPFPLNGYVEILDSSFIIANLAPQSDERVSFRARVLATIPDNGKIATISGRDRLNRLYEFSVDLQSPLPPPTISTKPSYTSVELRWTAPPSTDIQGYILFRDGALLTDHPISSCRYIDSELMPDTDYRYTLYSVDSSGNWSLARTATVHTNLSPISGFPVGLGEKIYSNVIVYDLDGDGQMEIIVAGQSGNLYVLDRNGRNKFGGGRVPVPVFSACGEIWASPAVGDVNRDGHPEILLATRGTRGRAYLLNFRGNILWEKDIENGALASCVMADLDNDGYLECIIAGQNRKIYVWRCNGSEFRDGDSNPVTDGVFATAYLDDEGEIYGSPIVEDINGDGRIEIVFVGGRNSRTGKGHLYAVGSDGTDLYGFPLTLDCWATASPVACNLDTDTLTKEIVLLVGSDKLLAFRSDGTVLAGFPKYIYRGQFDISSPAVADIDNDGIDEIFVDTWGRFYIFKADGTLYGYPIVKPFSGECSPIVVDVDNDGVKEIVLGGVDGYVYAWELDGSNVSGFPIDVGGYIGTSPTFADIDGDRRGDIIVGSYSQKVFAWRSSGSAGATERGWFTFRGDYQRRGGKSTYFELNVKEACTANITTLSPYPEPFNSSVFIPFGDEPPEYVHIFNMLGQIVFYKVFAPGGNEAGFIWDGSDLHGQLLSSGTYFYRFTGKNVYRVGRVHLVR